MEVLPNALFSKNIGEINLFDDNTQKHISLNKIVLYQNVIIFLDRVIKINFLNFLNEYYTKAS